MPRSFLPVRLTRRAFAKGLAAVPVAGSALLVQPGRLFAQSGQKVRVGSKDFTEQFILGQMYILLLENAGIATEDKTNLGGTGIAHKALTSGNIDLYPEYPGTALEAIFNTPVASLAAGNGGTPAASPVANASPIAGGTPGAGGMTLDQLVYDTVAQKELTENNIVLLDQTVFNDTQALAVKRSFSTDKNVTTISQLVAIADQLTISAPVDFAERQDGLLGLQRVYGDFNFKKILGVQPALKYKNIQNGSAEVVLAFSTDAQIAALDLVVLQDDKGLWPPYHCAPFVRKPVLDAYPTIRDALNPIAPLLTNDAMTRLNAGVDIDGKEPKVVAQAFLRDNGLLPK